MTALGDDLLRMASDVLTGIGQDIEDELADIQFRESTRFWRRGENDYVEFMTIEVGDGVHWYVMKMPHAWDLCEVAQERGGDDTHVQDYIDVRDAIRDLAAHEVALRLGEIL